MTQVVVTARIDADIAAKLDRIGAEYERSRAWLIAKAVERYANEGVAYLDMLQEGLDDVAAGHGHTQEEVEAIFTARYERRNAA